MANIRSSLPLRFRQLLSEQGTGPFPHLKESETTPPKIKAFIDRVIKSPLCDIAIPLSGFRWEYSKGNFQHWRPLFLHFDTYFKTYLSSRKDLQLSDNIFDDDDPLPKHTVLLILRVMQTILENCHNKSSFGCQEHLKLLLTSTDPEVLIATLETLCALVKIIPSKLHVSGKLIGCGSMNSCLLSLAQGWGSKEEGLGLCSCIVANEKIQEEGLSLFPSDVGNDYDKSQYQLGTTLHFGFHVNSSQGTEKNSGRRQSSKVHVIHIPDLHLRKEDDLTILKQCVDQYGVPPENRFSLLTRIRYTRSFLSPKRCRLYSRICLLAFIVLVQSNDAHEELASFFANEPEYTNDLIRLVQSEDAVPGSIRTLAMLALGAQLAAYSSSHERARILNGSGIISAGGNRMVLLDVLQKVVLSLNNSSDPSSLSFLDALLQFYLLHVISSSSSGGTVRGSGMVPTLLSLIQDVDSAHSDLLFSAVKTLQKLMDYSFAAVSLFKDLGGVELLAHRLQTEVHRVVGTDSENSVSVTTENLSKVDDSMFNSQKRLIRAFLKALGSASYSPQNSTRSQNYYDNSLPNSLSLIFQNVGKFGGDIYFSAVTLMSEIIHKDPTCFSMLHELGLPEAFLSSVSSQILLSSKALTCIPCGLGAICLNSKGLEAVRETSALRFLVEACTTRKCLLAMNRGVMPLSSAVEELLRHVPTLRSTGVDIIIEIIEKLSLLGKDICTGSSSNIEGGTEMFLETDPQYKDSSCHEDLLDGADPTADGVSNEQFVRLCIFHVMVLVRRVMENSENCRLFVEKKGIEALMKLLLQPSIVRSPEGMSVALHSTMVFKGFTQHHSTPLAHAFCSSLRDHLKKALSGFSSTAGLCSLGSRPPPDSSMFSPLFVVEFLLFLAASKETRWVSALLAEFGNGSKDVLEDIGRVHREVLWQIALLDDAKLELKDDICISCGGSQRLDPNANDNDEQRFNFFRRFLDPLMRRRVPGRSVDSQFFDLVNMYHDVGRATGLQHSLGMDGPSSLQLGSGHQLQPSSSSDTGAVGRMEDDTQQSWYSSCCDMMRSLSLHISHLFLELGKVMLAPSHRSDDSLVVSPSAKSVVSTFASVARDHVSFSGHVNPSKREAFISTKCRYLGKVIKFINSILMDRPESYNPLLLNCFYCHGVFQAILTTFEATSQLHFNVSRMSSSPMAIDDGNLARNMDGKIDDSWIYGSLASYGTLMDHLVTSSFIISPFTKHLLCQNITEGNVPVPRDAETFVKVLQSMVLKAVLPIWSHPHFPDCSYDFVTAIVSILRHIYSGVEVKNTNVNARAQMVGPPPDESAISRIVEMGFSRPRAEEALRQVRTNSVEMAMEWLVSHLEEAQEDDELARALAMSLGSSGGSIKEDKVANAVDPHHEVVIQLPTDDELLLACIQLLQRKEPLVFPVRDLLLMICSQNDGCYRSKVVTSVIDQVKLCSSVSDCNETKLSAYFHVLALVLHEDSAARELAFQHGLVKISLDLLSHWDPVLHGEKTEVPKWVTTTFLAIDQMLQVDPKLSSEILAPEQLKKDNLTNKLTVVSDEKKANSLLPTLGLKCSMDINEQKRLIVIACRCIRSKLPPETMHAVLQLCASLTKIHSIALTFLDAGGLPSLLNLPSSSLFSGFDNVSSAVIRHILEDPQTLQQAMEAEIRQTVVSALSRHSNGRLTPRIFLQNLAFVIARDPSVFMKAAQSVCQIQMVGERPHIVLLKDREKEKCKEKDKDKALDKDKQHVADGNDHGKLPDSSTKNVKAHRKPPQSFVSVIELLLDFVINFVPSPNDDGMVDGVYTNPSIAEMDVDGSENKGKGIAIADVSAESGGDNLEASTSLAKIVFILKLLSEILSTYTSSVHVLLRRDAEVNNCRGLPQRGPTANCNGGIIRHILHNLLPYTGRYKKDKKVDSDWRHKLSSRASQFLVTSSTRSTEGRRRVFAEISSILNDFVDSADGYRAPDYHIHAYVDLLNDILVARSPTGPFISAEASTTFIDVGLIRSLTRTLEVLDLDHVDSPKIVTGIVKALELVSKEQIHSPDPSSAKGLISVRQTSDHGQPGGEDNGSNQLQSETTSQCNQNEVAPDHVEPSNAVRTHGSSDPITDDMEQEQDMNVCFPPETEDDSMHEASEEAGGIGNGVATVEIRFGIPHNVQDNSVDEDDGTSAEEEDEDEVDDEEENNDFEEDDVHHMSHPDTDQDENEIEEEEFDEDVVEDEDEDDEDDEDGVILRLEEGINGINVFDHIEVFGRENHFSNDTLHVMPVGVFGSRRHGRTTSIYNLLGRNGDSAAPLQHPLLVEPSSLHPVSFRQSGDVIVTDGSLEDTSSRLDVVFRSLRSGRHGHRFNTWVDDGQQRTGSNVRPIPPGMEELLISQLRRPAPGQSLDHNKPPTGPQDKVEMNQLWDSSEREEAPVQNNLNCESVVIQSPSSAGMDRTGNAVVEPMGNDFIQEREVSNVESHATDMQYDRNDAVARDVEAVSQGSSGSGATLGESLRSLEVEIGSADGHDDGGERPLGDLQPTRMRRVTVSLGNATHIANRDMSLHSVNEVSPHPNQVLDQSGPAEEQQINSNTDMGSIDPAFLDALPEQLRVDVLSARQNQAAQPSTDPPQSVGDIDPEFLAALPPDIRAEVLAQQQTQRLQQSQEFEGQPVEMDTVSIIATFPSDLREEVLLTSSDAILANLTPALVAEANMLRERFAHRYHNRTLLGMYPRNRRGESSRRGEAVRSSLDRATGALGSHRSVGGKLAEADGVPLVDNGALRSMIRLLRVVQLPYKSQLQRLFLNLCAHPETRTSLVQILMDMLMLDTLGPATESNGTVEPSYRLYGCQSSVTYSRPQFLDGVPPLVSRRILEYLSYLAQNHPSVARLLLHLQLPRLPVHTAGQMRGKAVMAVEDDRTETKQRNGEFSIFLLLNLLNQPLYLRSVAHLEQLLTLLEVVISNAKSNSSLSNKSALSPPDQPSASQNAKTEASLNTGTVGTSALDVKSSKNGAFNSENDTLLVLLSLPQTELRFLCSLLAREGLSENAYVLVAEVLKKLVAIAPTHCHLFITELADSVRSLTRSAMIELHGYGEGEKKLLSTATTDGTAILRVLQALSSLVSSLLEKQKEKNHHLLPDIDYNSALSRVWDIKLVLEPLWLELSACIIKIESCVDGAAGLPSSLRSLASTGNGVMPPLPVPPGTQNILPYIESFFVACEKLCPGQSGATHDFSTANTSDVEDVILAGDQNFPGSNAKADEKHVAFVKFSEKHRKLLNAFIRQNPGLLEKSLSLMLKVPRFIDFDNKRAHFRSKMKHQHDHHHNPLRISVRRAYILEDSYNQLRLRPEQDLKGRLTVHFQGEEGIDAGGLTREWYQSLSRVVFDKGALLFTTVGNESTFQPNPNSVYQTEHLSYFKFVGRVVGKALFDGQLLDVHFTRSFYKHILGIKVTYHDIEAIDPHYFRNLKWMLENDISDVLDLTFSIDADEEKLILYERAEVTDHELIPGGQNIKVTEENKNEYVNLVAEHRLTTSIRPQINAFMEGFSELIPRDLISIFNDKELELLISGLPDIDLDDMRANTEYSGYSAASPVIQWFWEVVQGFSKEDKARLLQFVTGTSKVPLEGFSALQGISGSQRFQIHKAYGSPRHLPSAHTCFNQLDLPEYPSKEQLQERLLLAIHEASEGFGFG